MSLSSALDKKKDDKGHWNYVLFIWVPGEWQSFWHQAQRGSRSCFTAPEMLAYPLAYIISPRCTLGRRRRRVTSSEVGEGGQVVKFPLANFFFSLFDSSPHLVGSFTSWGFDNRSGPPHPPAWEAASSDSSLSPTCACCPAQRSERNLRSQTLSPSMQMHVKNRATKKKKSSGSSFHHFGWEYVYSLSLTGK